MSETLQDSAFRTYETELRSLAGEADHAVQTAEIRAAAGRDEDEWLKKNQPALGSWQDEMGGSRRPCKRLGVWLLSRKLMSTSVA